jgi:hypothetical protein
MDKLYLIHTRLVGDSKRVFFLNAKCQNGCPQLDNGEYIHRLILKGKMSSYVFFSSIWATNFISMKPILQFCFHNCPPFGNSLISNLK